MNTKTTRREFLSAASTAIAGGAVLAAALAGQSAGGDLAARQAIAEAGSDGGFILGSGCEVPVAAPPENLKAMIAVARSAT